jgi:hypothetical protein
MSVSHPNTSMKMINVIMSFTSYRAAWSRATAQPLPDGA